MWASGTVLDHTCALLTAFINSLTFAKSSIVFVATPPVKVVAPVFILSIIISSSPTATAVVIADTKLDFKSIFVLFISSFESFSCDIILSGLALKWAKSPPSPLAPLSPNIDLTTFL